MHLMRYSHIRLLLGVVEDSLMINKKGSQGCKMSGLAMQLVPLRHECQ